MLFLYIKGSIPKRSTGADCKSAGVSLRKFESYSAHIYFLSMLMNPDKIGLSFIKIFLILILVSGVVFFILSYLH